MTSAVRPVHLATGHARHGVERYARQLAAATNCHVVEHHPRPSDDRVHLHFTDRLWGLNAAEAAARVERIAVGHRLSVTLHDLPQTSDGAVAQTRRRDAYRRVLAVAHAVVCNSAWERDLLGDLGLAVSATVIPLPVIRRPDIRPPDIPAAAAAESPSVGLLGWFYPGKGHTDVIAAVAARASVADPPVRVVSLGGVSDGHAKEAEHLRTEAAQQGVAFSITGFLSDADLITRAAQITVPVAAHRHISASGSINTWLSLGRRPLVTDSAYAREMSRLRPGTLTLCAREGLADAVNRAVSDPETTWLPGDVDLGPDLDAVADAYLRWWTETVPW
jgi:hypothetical protein